MPVGACLCTLGTPASPGPRAALAHPAPGHWPRPCARGQGARPPAPWPSCPASGPTWTPPSGLCFVVLEGPLVHFPGDTSLPSAGGRSACCPEDCRRVQRGHAEFLGLRLGPPPPGYHPVPFLDGLCEVGVGGPPRTESTRCPTLQPACRVLRGQRPGPPLSVSRLLRAGGEQQAQGRPGPQDRDTHRAGPARRQQVGEAAPLTRVWGWSAAPALGPQLCTFSARLPRFPPAFHATDTAGHRWQRFPRPREQGLWVSHGGPTAGSSTEGTHQAAGQHQVAPAVSLQLPAPQGPAQTGGGRQGTEGACPGTRGRWAGGPGGRGLRDAPFLSAGGHTGPAAEGTGGLSRFSLDFCGTSWRGVRRPVGGGGAWPHISVPVAASRNALPSPRRPSPWEASPGLCFQGQRVSRRHTGPWTLWWDWTWPPSPGAPVPGGRGEQGAAPRSSRHCAGPCGLLTGGRAGGGGWAAWTRRQRPQAQTQLTRSGKYEVRRRAERLQVHLQ